MRLLVASVWGLIGAWAATAAAVPYEVTVGFGGGYKTGAWTPVSVAGEAVAIGDELHVWAEDPDGQFVRSPPAFATAGADGLPAATFVVRFGRPTGRLRVERSGAEAGGIVACRIPEPLPSTARLVLVAGDLPAAAAAARVIAREDGVLPRVLPLGAGRTAAGGSARDYDAAEAIVVCGRALAGVPADVLQGIDAWVRLGGRLVMVAGESAAGLPPVAAGWLPGPVSRLATLRRLGGIETRARAGRLPAGAAAGLKVPLFAAARGVVDVAEGGGDAATPLMARYCHGLGTIAWLGIDVDAEPLRDWPGTASLLADLLGGRPDPVDREPTGGGDRQADLAVQLRTALERFAAAPGASPVSPVPFEVVAGIGLLYVLCLYPLDWWLVSRAGGRPWVAWSSLGALVGGFTALAWGVHAALGVGGQAVNVTEVVDVDAAGGTVRGSGWAAIHADANGQFEAALDTQPAADRALSWWGDAGRGFAAVDAAMPHPSLAAADYAYAATLAALERVPIAAASSRVFEGEWEAAVEAGGLVTADLRAGDQAMLHGGLTHHLPVPLENCRLVHAGWLYDVGRLEPGQRYDTASGRGPRSLAAALTRRAAAKERDVAARWNPAEADVDRILEVAGFHAAAGGEAYTLVPGGRLARLDLTPLVRLDRAVLVGFASRGQATWSFAGRPAASRGLYRIVIPVAAAAAR